MISKKLIRIKDLIEKLSVSRTTVNRIINKKTFPKKVVLSNGLVSWIESEVDEWIESFKSDSRSNSEIEK